MIIPPRESSAIKLAHVVNLVSDCFSPRAGRLSYLSRFFALIGELSSSGGRAFALGIIAVRGFFMLNVESNRCSIHGREDRGIMRKYRKGLVLIFRSLVL